MPTWHVHDTLPAGSAPHLTAPRPYPDPPGARYILPCPALHHGGCYEYVLVSADQARAWIQAGPFVSYVSHPEWAWMLAQILSPRHGFPIPHVPAGTALPPLGYDDAALIFIPDGGELVAQRWDRDRQYSQWVVAQERYTLGLLVNSGTSHTVVPHLRSGDSR